MKMQLLPAGNARDLGKVVDGARIHRAGGAHHEKRLEAGSAIDGNGGGKACHIHAPHLVNGNRAQIVLAEAGQVHALGDAAMRPGGGVRRQAPRSLRHAG